MIRQEKGKHVVRSKAGKLLGSHDSKEKAEAQLRAIEYSKAARRRAPAAQRQRMRRRRQ
jgi:hypothetical protein